jgi:beta-lactamase class A
MITRRSALAAAALGVIKTTTASAAAKPTADFGPAFRAQIAAIEKATGGRLGVAILDTATSTAFAWRGDERFPFCSTFKFLLATAILQRIDRKEESASRPVILRARDLIQNSPFTETHTADNTATVLELCGAMVTLSDNTAANTMLASIGGPEAFTKFVRTLGDTVTRLDRNELALNEAVPGDPRDTTSPRAMLADMNKVLLGNVLSPTSRKLLLGWMFECQTGKDRLRAGVPAGWRVADKTGLNGIGTCNDIAIIYPPRRAPILITSYLTAATVTLPQQTATHATIARALVSAIT